MQKQRSELFWIKFIKLLAAVKRPAETTFSGFGRSRKWRRIWSPVMAVTETTAETGGSLSAVTVAETETDCRAMDNDSRSKGSMRTEAIEPDHP